MNHLMIGPDINFDTATKIYEEVIKMMEEEKSLTVSFDFTTGASSVLAALVVSWMKHAKQKKCILKFSHLPQGVFVLLGHNELVACLNQYCN